MARLLLIAYLGFLLFTMITAGGESLGDTCGNDSDCPGEFQECSTVCVCISGFVGTDGQNECHCPTPIPDGYPGGACIDDACFDKRSVCEFGICNCDSPTDNVNGQCLIDEEVGAPCFERTPEPGECFPAMCDDPNAECKKLSSSRVCICNPGYTSTAGQCIEDGSLGGACSTSTDCSGCNQFCSNSWCACSDGYSAIGGDCIEDGRVNGYCDAGACPVDKYAECNVTANMCMCVTGYSAIGGWCVQDGTAGGICLPEEGGAPCLTKNTVCVLAMCMCTPGFRIVDGMCRKDGTVGGVCDGSMGLSCSQDKNAICMISGGFYDMCVCQFGFTSFEGYCIQDGAAGGFCVNGACPNDKFALCDSTSDMCMCPTGSSRVNGQCALDGMPGGCCDASDQCPGDKNSVCEGELCNCASGYTKVGGMCVNDETVFGTCTGPDGVECLGDWNAICQDECCICRRGFRAIGGACVRDFTLGGFCDWRCKDGKYVVCNHHTYMCVCRHGYYAAGGRCFRARNSGHRH